jgi:hypothetical protein
MVWIVVAHIIMAGHPQTEIWAVNGIHTAFASPDGCYRQANEFNRSQTSIRFECQELTIKK